MSDTVRFEECFVAAATGKALLINIENEERWVPISVIHDNSEVFDNEDNSEGTLVVKAWWAEKEGLS